MSHALLLISLISLSHSPLSFGAPSSPVAPAPGWTIGERAHSTPRELGDTYLAAIRILDQQESALKTSALPSDFNPYFSTAWASANSCLLAGWEGEIGSNGRCLPKQNGFEAARGKCATVESPSQQVPCNPAIFGDDLGCVQLERSNNHWTRACTEALLRKVGDPSTAVSLSTSSSALEAFLSLHPELVKNAQNLASSVCVSGSTRKTDQSDCALLEKFMHAKAHPLKAQKAESCANGASVLGKDASACVTTAENAIHSRESYAYLAKCQDANCREQRLKSEIKLGLTATLNQLKTASNKTGSEFSYPMTAGKCELTLGYLMLKPYDASVSSIKESKMKPVKTLVLKIQNQDHYHAFVDRKHDLQKNLNQFIQGTDGDSSFNGTVLQSAQEACL